MPRISMANLRANPPKLTEAEKERLDSMTDDEIERNALDDSECPPMSDEQLERAVFARDVRQTREATGLTQEAFARRYAIRLSRLKDWEQGRFKPDSVAAAYIKVVRHNPRLVQEVLETQD